MPDSQEITEEVAHSVRMMEIVEYGKERLPAGPAINDSDEIIVVEGRADVLTLLKMGIKNIIALNGTSVPKTIIDLSKRKEMTIFVDGDRGGDLIIKELMDVAEIDFVIKAPDGKEVEELTKKEINKSLRNKVASEQAKLEVNRPKKIERKTTKELTKKEIIKKPIRKKLNSNESKLYKKMLNDLVGTRGAYLLDESTNILGKVPTSELTTTIKSLKSGINAVVFDGTIDFDLIKLAEKSGIKNLISMNSKVVRSQKVKIITKQDLE